MLGLTLDEAVDLMRGPVGSEITITIAREGTDDPFEVKITRETITVAAGEVAHRGRDRRAAAHHLQRADLSETSRSS